MNVSVLLRMDSCLRQNAVSASISRQTVPRIDLCRHISTKRRCALVQSYLDAPQRQVVVTHDETVEETGEDRRRQEERLTARRSSCKRVSGQ